MTENGEEKRNYRVRRVDEMPQETEMLPEDPLDNLPDPLAREGLLPIVAFVLLCLSGFAVMVIARAVTSGSALIATGCILTLAVVLFGIAALVRGMFASLRRQEKGQTARRLSACVMAAACVLGIALGVLFVV